MAQIVYDDGAGRPLFSPRSAIIELDGGGLVSGWSEPAQRLLGYHSSEIIGRPGGLLLFDEADPALIDHCQSSEIWVKGLALRHRNGRRVEVGIRVRAVARGRGETGWVVTVVEAQELDHWEANQAVLQGLMGQATFGLAVIDPDLRCTWINSALERRGGVPASRRLGRRLGEYLPDLPVDAIEKTMRHVLETGEPAIDWEFLGYTAAHPDRRTASSATYFRLEDATGRVLGVCCSIIDSTDRYLARQRLALVNEASARVGTTLDVVRTAEELAEVSVPALADSAAVDLMEWTVRAEEECPPLSGALLVHRGALNGVYDETFPAPDAQPGESFYAEPQTLYWRVLNEGRSHLETMQDGTSVMLVPLIARGITLGLAAFLRTARHGPFETDDLLLAEELAARAAVSLDSARRFTREHKTALALQRSLLPQAAPRLNAAEIAHRYLPTMATAGVGGDWFDVIPLSGARGAFVIGDVVGHGIQASAAMGRLRTAVRTLVELDLSPDELLPRLEDLVSHFTEESAGEEGDGLRPTAGVNGATCLYAVYDPISRQLAVARAGHPPPLVVYPDGRTELLDVPAGLPLGLGDVSFETLEVHLPEGALLALYTDGLVSTREQDIDTGLEKLRDTLARPSGSLETHCDAVVETLLPNGPLDDAALLLARLHGLPEDRVADLGIPHDPSFVRHVRSWVDSQLAAWDLEESVFTTELVVSELVANAIRYGRPPITLRLIHDVALICEVSDGSSTSPHIRKAAAEDEGGRGLYLVAQLTDRWGTRYTPVGKTIWAEQLPAFRSAGT